MKFFVVFVICLASPFTCLAQELDMVEDFFNNLTTMQANFVQTSPDGKIARGVLLMKRPDKILLEYDVSLPITVFVNKGIVTYVDRKLEQVSTLPARKTIASLLTKKKFSFDDGDVTVNEVKVVDGGVVVSFEKTDKADEGEFTMFFKITPGKTVEPTRIQVKSTSGVNAGVTKIDFTSVKYGVAIPDDRFEIEVKVKTNIPAKLK